MKRIWVIAVLSMVVCAFVSCGRQPADVQFVRQIIPIEIQRGKPVTIEVSLSGNGENQVGIRCSTEVWTTLTNGTKPIRVQVKSCSGKGTKIGGIAPGSGKRWPIESFHYLFNISGERNARASLEIAFADAPTEPSHAEIIIDKTPPDTGL